MYLFNNNNNNNNSVTMFMVLSSWPWSLRELTWFIWWMQTERWVAANSQSKPTDLGCESADKWLLPSTSTIAICYYYSAESWYSFYRPMEGGRLSQPTHCRKGAQPVPKAVHRTGCRDKHNWPRPLTPQSIMPSLNHCDLLRHVVYTTCLRLLLDSAVAGNWTRNLRVASPTP